MAKHLRIYARKDSWSNRQSLMKTYQWKAAHSQDLYPNTNSPTISVAIRASFHLKKKKVLMQG